MAKCCFIYFESFVLNCSSPLSPFTSCSGNLDATIKGDSSVRAAIRLDIPDALSVRVRQFVGLKPQEPLFSTEAVRKQFLGQTNIALVDVSSPTPDILTSVVWVQNLEALIADTSLVPMGMICYQKSHHQGNLRPCASFPSIFREKMHPPC